MTNSLTIEEINVLQAENERLKMELAARNQMLMDAHFQNKKLSDELVITQNQYNKVVEQNKNYNMRNMELEKVFKKIFNIANVCDMPSCLDADCNCDICHDEITDNGKRCMQKGMREIIKLLTTSNDVEK